MAIQTEITAMFGLQYPILLAPMGGVAGGRLAAAVSNAGGLGLVGGGYADHAWLRRELDIAAGAAEAPWGVGLIGWCLNEDALDLVLAYRPAAVMLSFGDFSPWAPAIKAAGARLICQVQDLRGAREARAAGADIVIAQGTEAGGHTGGRASLPLIPAVADAVAPVPTVAAGGIADGRGIAAALMLGAQGVLMGTRFYATHEALGAGKAKELIAAASGDATIRTGVFDSVRDLAWPERYSGRALNNTFAELWHGYGDDLRASMHFERRRYRKATELNDFDTAVVWAGECVDLIERVESASELVQRLGQEAEQRLAGASAYCRRAAAQVARLPSRKPQRAQR